jgi:hypothetical protein
MQGVYTLLRQYNGLGGDAFLAYQAFVDICVSALRYRTRRIGAAGTLLTTEQSAA